MNEDPKKIIDISGLESNSISKKVRDQKEERTPARRVVKGRASRRRSGKAQSSPTNPIVDNVREVTSYVIFEVLLPSAKNVLQEMIFSGIEMLLYGDEARPARFSHTRRRPSGSSGSVVSYGSYFTGSQERQNSSRRTRPIYGHHLAGVDDIVIEDRGEAEDVMDTLMEYLDDYGQVSVADYYEMVGFEGGDWTDTKRGWTNLSKMELRKVPGGWTILLPREVRL